MKRSLTEKEKKTIDLIASGKTPTEACLMAYDCKDKRSASVVASTLLRKDMFKKELAERKNLALEIIRGEGRKLAEILEEIFPKSERAEKLAEIARSGDIRSVLEAIKEMNKISGEYPDAKVGVYHDMKSEREAVLTERELVEGVLENRKELPLIDEGLIKEEEVFNSAGLNN